MSLKNSKLPDAVEPVFLSCKGTSAAELLNTCLQTHPIAKFVVDNT
jgi:hypothetical protein